MLATSGSPYFYLLKNRAICSLRSNSILAVSVSKRHDLFFASVSGVAKSMRSQEMTQSPPSFGHSAQGKINHAECDGLGVELHILLSDSPVVLSVSSGVEALLGFTPDNFMAGHISLPDRIHPEDDDLASLLFLNLDSPVYGGFPIRLRQANGQIRIVRLDFEKSSANESGVILRLILKDAKALFDIENASADIHFKYMMDSTDDFICFKNKNHVITGASQALASICPRVDHWADLIGQTDYDLFPEEFADKCYRLEKLIYSGIPSVNVEQEYVQVNGVNGWVNIRKYPIHCDRGEIVGVFGVSRDITERKIFEEALKKSEARLTLAQRMSHLGNWELDLISNVLWWSEEIFRIFEVDLKRFKPSYEAFLAVVHPDDRAVVSSAYLNSLKSKIPYEIEHRLLLTDGRIKYVHERCETVYDSAGNPLRSVGTVQDISDRKRLRLEGTDMLRRIESLILQMDDRTVAVTPQDNITARSDDGAGTLSRRHLDVIELIAAGLTSAQIAARLNISQTTVITHRRNLMRKLGLHSAAELTAYAIKNKIVAC
ncbi:MAG TPA: hypothetical protein DE312_02165 [Gallionella sp.]|nr:hypothetical protein [Gallionella sp.]